MKALIFALLLSFLGPISAQSTITVSSSSFPYPGVLTGGHVVRDSAGVLYLATIDESTAGIRPIQVYRSYDGGSSWTLVVPGGINDSASGLDTGVLVNQVTMAIDDQDRLHFHWGRFSYPNFYNSYYRTLDTHTGQLSPVVDVQAMLGIPTTVRTTACNVAVGPQGTVWLTAASSQSWRTQLLQSTQPYGAGGTFQSVGVVSTTASAQSVRIAVDALGSVQCTYYENTGTGDYRHRIYDVLTSTWTPATDLGNLAAPNDYWGDVACDLMGNTHMLVFVDAAGSNPQPMLEYYRRDPTGVFQGPVTIMSATSTQFGSNNRYVIDLACDEATGDAYVLYRDFVNGGSLAFGLIPAGTTTYVPITNVTPPSSVAHQYYSPRIRGRLWPASDRTGSDFQFTWREGTSSPYLLNFQNYSASNPMLSVVGFQPAPVVTAGGVVTVTFDAPAHPSENYLPFVSCTLGLLPTGFGVNLPVLFDDCMNFYFNDPLSPFIFMLAPYPSSFGPLDASGSATGSVAIPATAPTGIPIPLQICFLTFTGNVVTGVSQVGTLLVN